MSTEPTAEEKAGTPFWRSRRFRWSAGAVAVAAVLLAGWAVVREPEPVGVVRDYLAAAREGDVAGALKIAGSGKPKALSDAFLTSRAVSDEWEIVSLEEADRGAGSREWARVDVTIAGQGETWATTEYTLDKQGGTWRIRSPFANVSFTENALWYLEVNGERVPIDSVLNREFALLPGLYRFHERSPEEVEVDMDDALLLGGHSPSGNAKSETIAAESVSLTGKGREAAREAVYGLIDECAADGDSLGLAGTCPFGADEEDVFEAVGDGTYPGKIRDVEWQVKRHPELSFDHDAETILVSDRKRGIAQVSGVNIGRDGGTEEFSIECEIVTDGLKVGFTEDQDVSPLPRGARNGGEEDEVFWHSDSCS